ncbi:MAG: hypothetical protein KDB82_03495 [Planctomycetes bacterium]|nr:hypothetical protein [Planctomycetota bacterium]
MSGLFSSKGGAAFAAVGGAVVITAVIHGSYMLLGVRESAVIKGIPLLVAFVIVLVICALAARGYWRDAQSISASKGETVRISSELESVREQQQQTLEQLRKRIEDVQAAKARAETERARLMKGLAEITGESGDGGGVTIALASAKEMAEHARQLEVHDGALAAHDNELGQLQEELNAAEELLRDVDTQRNALESQLKDRDRELWKLRNEIESVRQKSSVQRARTMMLTRSNIRKTDVVANRLEDQLKRWVKKTGPVNVNFSEHGHAVTVKEAFEKLDREFLDRYFSHATNPEYERGQRRSIHVHGGKDPDGTEYGELRVALDDDAGRTLGLRFELRGGAPDVKSVGFVLAMYLRAMNRDLRDFDLLVH